MHSYTFAYIIDDSERELAMEPVLLVVDRLGRRPPLSLPT